MRWLTCLLLSTIIVSAVHARDLTVVSEGPAQMTAERLVVRSERVGRDFQIDVWTPNTRPWLPGQKAAAAYILDGGYGMAGPIASPLGNTDAMQAAYIVTVGYPSGRNAREVDLLFGPGVRADGTIAKGGGAEAFTAFLLEELKPFIEARYPVDPRNAVLMGHSLAGIYTANVLARRPEAFAGYVIASPSVWAQPDILARLTAMPPGVARPRVFVAYGGQETQEMIDGGRAVAQAVTANPAFDSRTRVFEDGEHVSYYSALVPVALSYVLPRKERIDRPASVAMTPDALERYIGTYRFADGRTLGVVLVNGALQATRTDRPPLTLAAKAPDQFFVPGLDWRLRFEGPASALPARLVLTINGDEAVGTRTPE